MFIEIMKDEVPIIFKLVSEWYTSKRLYFSGSIPENRYVRDLVETK